MIDAEIRWPWPRRNLIRLLVVLVVVGTSVRAWATPAEAERLRARAGKALERKDYPEAEALLERAIKADPKKHAIVKDLAVVLASDGKIDESAARYREYLKAVPKDEAAALALATTLSWGKEQRQRDEADKLLSEYLTRHPDSSEALLQRARVRSWSGHVDEADADFQAYLAKHPDEKIRLELAQALSSKKDAAALDRAVAIYDAHLATSPGDAEVLLQRARVHSWANHIPESIADYRTYLKSHPNDEAAAAELTKVLGWSKQLEDQERAIAALDERLRAHPDDKDALLARARAYAATRQQERAVADYRAYLKLAPDEHARLELANLLADSKSQAERDEALAVLEDFIAKHPDDERAPLSAARVLAARKDKASLERAIALYDAWLAKHPDDKVILLQRARVKAWAGRIKEAAADFRAYGAKSPGDDSYLLELANALAQGPSPGEALPVYDEYLSKHPDSFEAASRRARTLLWVGDYGRAESALETLAARAKTPSERADVEVDLARLYAQTGRRYQALDLLDAVLARDAKNAAAQAERDRVAILVASRIEPRVFVYDDKSGIRIIAVSAESRVALSKRLAVIADVGGWSLGTNQETLFAGRVNLGAWTRIGSGLELEAAGGPRLYQYFDTKLGVRVAARARPARWASAMLQYQYDDIYFDMLQPASVSAQIRGHGVFLTGDITLPIDQIRVTGRLGTRALTPDNNSFEATGTLMVPVVGPLSVGYTTQFITWRYNDPSYWSPQEFAAHLGVVRVAQTFFRSGFGYDVQGVLGIAGERILGLPEAGFGPSFGGSGAIIYSPIPRLELRLSAQYSQTVREIPAAVVGGSSGSAVVQTTTSRSPSKYYWILGSASAIIYF